MRDVFRSRRVQFNRGEDLHSVEDQFSVAEARQREGWAPKTQAPSVEQTNSDIWFNWRSSRSNKRLPIAEYKRNILLTL